MELPKNHLHSGFIDDMRRYDLLAENDTLNPQGAKIIKGIAEHNQ